MTGGSTGALSLFLDPNLGLQTTWSQHYQWPDWKWGLFPVMSWDRCMGAHRWHSCSVEYATEPGHVQVRCICCVSFITELQVIPSPHLPFDKSVKRAAAPLQHSLLQLAEHLPAAGDWNYASGLKLDKDVPPLPKHFRDVWWLQMSGVQGEDWQTIMLQWR